MIDDRGLMIGGTRGAYSVFFNQQSRDRGIINHQSVSMTSKSLMVALCLGLCLPALAQDAVTTVQPAGDASPAPAYGTEPAAPAPPSGDQNANLEIGAPGVAATPAPLATPAALATPPVPDGGPEANTLAPSLETQKQARNYILQIPAPRGQITDRQGRPLAQTRVSNNLALNFPTSPPMDDTETLAFAHDQITLARTMLDKDITVSDDTILKHYHNRGLLPLDIALDLLPDEIAAVKQQAPEHLSLHPMYQRFYPNGPLAGHILGYAGRSGRQADGPVAE